MSLMDAKFEHEVEFYLVDDGSTDEDIPTLISMFKPAGCKVNSIRLPKNQGISKALVYGLQAALKNDCGLFMVLDSDTIVKPDFFQVLFDLKLRFMNYIVSGFNTQTIDHETGNPRHKTIETFGDFVKKKTIGGINMFFTLGQYNTIILRALKSPGHWDWNACKYSVMPFIVSRPSVVQHIGISEGKHLNNPDVAFDFDE